MYRAIFMLILALLTLACAQNYSYDAVLPKDVPFAASPVEGVESAALIGDSSRAELYVSNGRIAEGVAFPMHTHSVARLSTVVSGTMFYGVGEIFAEVEFTPYPAGTVVYMPPNTPHWMWVKDGEIIVQESGFGPSETTFLEGE